MHGHLNVAPWLHATYDLNVDDARAHDNCALHWA